jgi:hypothetical protein
VQGALPVFWKTIWKVVWPAPLLLFAVVAFSWLVAQARVDEPGTAVEPPVAPVEPVDPDASAVDMEVGWAPEVSVESFPLVLDDEEEGAEEEGDDEDEDDVSSGPHAASASPATTSATAGIARRAVLVTMVSLFRK